MSNLFFEIMSPTDKKLPTDNKLNRLAAFYLLVIFFYTEINFLAINNGCSNL